MSIMRTLAIIALALSLSSSALAQTATETVYLKNGGVFSGTIVEFRPGESLIIQNSIGDRIVCAMSDIEKVTREVAKSDERANVVGYPRKGYRGFVDMNVLAGRFNVDGQSLTWAGYGLLTSHGCQINQRYFLGGGMGLMLIGGDDYLYQMTSYAEDVSEADFLLFFADFRADFLPKKTTPFADVRIGTMVGDVYGANVSLSAGVRVGRFNASVGYMGVFGNLDYIDEGCDYHAFALRLGVDIGRRM